MNDATVDVAIVGAGPVGATLALDLARRGVRTVVLEQSPQPRELPKMERCNARTMEIYRRLGLADRIRAASSFTDVPMDVFVAASFRRPPLLHLRYPSATELKRTIADVRDGSMPVEPQQLISQYTLEPILRDAAVAAGATIRFGARVTGFRQDDGGVTVQSQTADGPASLRASWLVGCDGGVSTVRKGLGIRLAGDGRIRRLHQVFFRSRSLFESIPFGPGRHYYFPDGAIVVQDDLRHFVVNFRGWKDGDDARARLRRLIDLDVDIEVLHEADWHHHLLVAERYGEDRVLLAGDAAHLVIPQGGLGMNTGVGDAVDLAWKLAAVVHGWGGPRLLSSYQCERREVGLRNRDASRIASEGVVRWRAAATEAIDDDTPEGRRVRAEVAALATEGQPVGHELLGIELGYAYSSSPVIVYDVEPAVPDIDRYRPGIEPGIRVPHLWLPGGEALQDVLGEGFTLIVRDDAEDAGFRPLVDALAAAGAPVDVVSLAGVEVPPFWDRRLVLVRPDAHVCWRGDALPADVGSVARHVLGFADGEGTGACPGQWASSAPARSTGA